MYHSKNYSEQLKNVTEGLLKTGKYKNIMHVPRLEKIVLNVGVGSISRDKKLVKNVMNNLELIAGQKPVSTLATRSISQFKVREGMHVGGKVTLRKESMFQFVQRLVYLVLQRINDFYGISDKSFDGKGNMSFGINDYSVFYEVPLDNERSHGMDIAFVTTAKTNEDGCALLKQWGLPIRRINYGS